MSLNRKKSTNALPMRSAAKKRQAMFAVQINALTRARASPALRARNALPAAVLPVRQARPTVNVRLRPLRTVPADVLTPAVPIIARQPHRRAREPATERRTPVPAQARPAAKGNSVLAVPARTVLSTRNAHVRPAKSPTDRVPACPRPAPAIQTAARGNSVPMPGQFPRHVQTVRQTPSAPAPAVSWPTAREAV